MHSFLPSIGPLYLSEWIKAWQIYLNLFIVISGQFLLCCSHSWSSSSLSTSSWKPRTTTTWFHCAVCSSTSSCCSVFPSLRDRRVPLLVPIYSLDIWNRWVS